METERVNFRVEETKFKNSRVKQNSFICARVFTVRLRAGVLIMNDLMTEREPKKYRITLDGRHANLSNCKIFELPLTRCTVRRIHSGPSVYTTISHALQY